LLDEETIAPDIEGFFKYRKPSFNQLCSEIFGWNALISSLNSDRILSEYREAKSFFE
jgi:hypothetical protein